MKRKMSKRLARLCLSLMLVSLLAPALSMPVHAEEEKCWVLQKVYVEMHEIEELDERLQTYDYKEYGDLWMRVGRPQYLSLDITMHMARPSNILRPGNTVTFNYDYDAQAEFSDLQYCSKNFYYKFWSDIEAVQYSLPENFKLEEFPYNVGPDSGEAHALHVESLKSDHVLYNPGVYVGNADEILTDPSSWDSNGTDVLKLGSQLSGTVPDGQEDELLAFWVSYYHSFATPGGFGGFYNPLFQEVYIYTWSTPTDQKVFVEAGNGPGETGEEIDSGVINPGSNHGGSGDDSGWTGGDHGDDGGNIVGIIAKIGGGAAAAGIGIKVIKGLAGKSGKSGGDGGKKKKKKKREEESGDDPRDEQKNEQKKDDEKKRYEMRVYKEFGDTIYAGKTVTLSARIVEISASGVEQTAPELTQQITISSSNYLQVGGTFLSGQYQSARVTAPEYDKTPPSTALVTFRLVAPGGSFTQHMRFKIKQADPLVVWPDLSNAIRDCHLDIIAGDNDTYPVRFFFHDVDQEPEKIEFGQYDHYEVTVEPADTMYTYWARIKNRTAPLDNKKIYGYENHWNGGTDYRNHYPHDIISFTATFKDGLELNGFINIILYPEGMSVYTEIKDGRIPVRAYKQQWYSDMESTYEGVSLRYNCVRRTENGVEVFHPEDCDLRYGKLQGDKGKEEDNVAMKYKYDVTASHFMPLDTLYEPTPGATYLMKIDVVWKEKPDDVLTLPFIFILEPKGPMEEWNAEYKKLRQRVVNFSTPETLEKNLEKVKALTPQNTSKYELRLINKAILREYIAYWESEAASENSFADAMEWLEIGAGLMDFFGDCAFTYIIYYYSTTKGYASAAPYIDAILSPAKDLMEDFAGRYTMAYIDGNDIDWDGFTKQITEKGKSALDDILFEMIPDDAKDFFKCNPVKLKTVGLMIACYILVDFSMNLAKNRIDLDDSGNRKDHLEMTDEEFEEETSWTNSIYAALLDTFKDMSLRFITSTVGKHIEKYLEKPNVREKLGKWVGGTINTLWKGEKTVRVGVMSTKQAYNSVLIESADSAKKLMKLRNGLFDVSIDAGRMGDRVKVFANWKKQATEAVKNINEEEIANILFGKKWFFSRNYNMWGLSLGVIFDKLVSKGAGKAYDLTTGQLVESVYQIEELEQDLKAQDEAEQAAAQMEAQVQAKIEANELISRLIRDIEKAETPEDARQLLDRFQKEIEPPQDDEQDDNDYAFDPDPEFKTGEDGCTYVVLKFRKNGTNEGYRFEYNLSKMLNNLVDSKLGVDFIKSLFGSDSPGFPEGKLPMPGDPPLPSELR